jgi:hypothetical protein
MQDQGCKSDAGVKSLIAMVIGAIQKWTSSVLARCE